MIEMETPLYIKAMLSVAAWCLIAVATYLLLRWLEVSFAPPLTDWGRAAALSQSAAAGVAALMVGLYWSRRPLAVAATVAVALLLAVLPLIQTLPL